MHGLGNAAVGVTFGLLSGAAVIAGLEHMGHSIFGTPKGLQKDMPFEEVREIVQQHIKESSPISLLWVIGAHGCGSLVGGFVAFKFAASPVFGKSAGVVGSLFLLGGLTNALAIPHPYWWTTCDLLVYVPAAYAGASLVQSQTPLLSS